MRPIPYATQDIDSSDIDAVVAVLRSDWLTQGPAIERFEHAVSERCGGAHAIAVSSATAGLHLACLALGLGPGGKLWTTPNTFVASANCARYCGADVDFVDIDPHTRNLCPEALETKLRQADIDGKLPDIVVPVHFAGLPADMARIAALAKRYGFRVIEDASHAIGARYDDGSAVGDGAYADITVFSFHAVKVLTTGEGGMALTRDVQLASRIRLLRSHGITRDVAQIGNVTEGAWYYEQLQLGFNYRMTDIQAALGLSQLARLDGFLDARELLVEAYEGLLAGLPLRLPESRWSGRSRSSWHLYAVQLEDESVRRRVFDRMRAAGILVNVHYFPVHLQPYYRQLGFREGDYPEAERHYRRALSLPMHTRLTEAQHAHVCESLAEGFVS